MNLTEQEIKEFRYKIYMAYSEFQKSGSKYALVSFIVWCYEYLEAYTSTKLVTNAKMSVIGKYLQNTLEWDATYQHTIKDLFHVRTKIVHRPYLINYLLKENTSYVDKHKSVNPIIFYNNNITTLIKILKIVDLDLENLWELRTINAFL